MTDDPRADYVRRTDPLADHRDAQGVLHRWDTSGPNGGTWYHPAGVRCRDVSCPGNRGALERLGGMPSDSTEADASAVRGVVHAYRDDDSLTRRHDAYATAYAALHETVRRFLDDGANVRYLRRNHAEIDVDLRARLHQITEPTEEPR